MHEREQQAADVRAVDVGIRHQDDLAVASLIEIKGAPGAGPDHLDDRRALGVLEHVGDGRLLRVEDLAANGEQRLELSVARELGRAQCAVTLDDEQLTAADVVAAAVSELGRQRRGFQRILTTLDIAMGTRRDAGARGACDLLEHSLDHELVAARRGRHPCRELLGHDRGDDAGRCRSAQDFLGLSLELRLGQTHRHESREALGDVVLDDVVLAGLEHLRRPQLLIDGLDQRALETADVGAALGRGDDVDERAHVGVVATPPPQCHVDAELALDLLAGHVSLGVEHRDGLLEVTVARQA